MKQMEKWGIIFLLVGMGIFVLLRIYQVFSKVDIETYPLRILGSEPQLQEHVYQLDLVMVGDALYHDGVYKDGLQSDGSYSFYHQLEFIKPIIKEYDLAYYNQESILGGESIGLSTYPRFNSPQEVGDAFLDAGFNLISTANNHTLDRGRAAVINSYNYFKNKENVLMSGSCDSELCRDEIPMSEKNGISYAFLAYTTTTNGIPVPTDAPYLVNVYSESQVTEDILKVKNQVDVIIVAMHWGVEYSDAPSDEQREIAQVLADLGVNIVIGTHPHVIEPIEKIGDTLVFYSLGNFISAQKGVDRLVGLMGSVSIIKTEKASEISIELTNIKSRLIYTYYDKNFRNFKVYPFEMIDTSILAEKEQIQKEKQSIVTSMGIGEVFST